MKNVGRKREREEEKWKLVREKREENVSQGRDLCQTYQDYNIESRMNETKKKERENARGKKRENERRRMKE